MWQKCSSMRTKMTLSDATDAHLYSAAVVEVARGLVSMGFTVFTTGGTHALLQDHSVETTLMPKISEGARPNILDKISNGEIDLLVNTPTRKGADTDEGRIRAAAVRHGVTLITTLAGARAAVQGISALRSGNWGVTALQDYFPEAPSPESFQPGDLQLSGR